MRRFEREAKAGAFPVRCRYRDLAYTSGIFGRASP